MNSNALATLAASLLIACGSASAQQYHRAPQPRHNVPTDSIRLSDPAVLADSATHTYYMTGTGGMMWKSHDLKLWDGPYSVVEVDTASWMGRHPQIWAAEIHKYDGRYYYFATFTNNAIVIDTVDTTPIPRRACHVMVSDTPDGPYRPVGTENYLPENKPTLDGTLWVEPDGTPYMVYCHEWLQNGNGTMEALPLKRDLSGPAGEPTLLFRASDSPWSRATNEPDDDRPNNVTDGPWLFRTDTGRLGMLWTSWIGKIYTQGVAYSQSGTIFGPWIQDPEPITPPDFGHSMLFKDLDGNWLMSVHSHFEEPNGRYRRIPRFFPINLSGDRLIVVTP